MTHDLTIHEDILYEVLINKLEQIQIPATYYRKMGIKKNDKIKLLETSSMLGGLTGGKSIVIVSGVSLEGSIALIGVKVVDHEGESFT